MGKKNKKTTKSKDRPRYECEAEGCSFNGLWTRIRKHIADIQRKALSGEATEAQLATWKKHVTALTPRYGDPPWDVDKQINPPKELIRKFWKKQSDRKLEREKIWREYYEDHPDPVELDTAAPQLDQAQQQQSAAKSTSVVCVKD